MKSYVVGIHYNHLFDKILICNRSNSFYEEISKELSDSFYCVPFLLADRYHYANMSVQYTAIFHGCKNDNFHMKFFDIFHLFAQNIDCGYTLEPPQ